MSVNLEATMTPERSNLLNEIRYAERLCQRTARLYRRVQSVTTFLSVLGGSAALSAAVSATMPTWLPVVGACVFAIFGAIAITIRPADKAAQNEQDAKRYAALRAKSHTLEDQALRQALDEARASDVGEIETLRDVAYNDIVREIGKSEAAVHLNFQQKVLAAWA